WQGFSEEQREAIRRGKPLYSFGNPVMRKKVNVMGATFIGVGLLFVVTGLLMSLMNRGHATSKTVVGATAGIALLGAAFVFAGILLLTLKKHPQRAPLLKWAVLGFCIAAGLLLFVVTGFSGSVIFTDIFQVVVIFFAMDVIIKQGRLRY
ncbi:MAG: hypothetical protein ACI364_02175, partial [Coriobacteriales bacterium]